MSPEATSTCAPRTGEDKIIEITGMHKWFGDLHVLNGIDMSVYKGERIVPRTGREEEYRRDAPRRPRDDRR